MNTEHEIPSPSKRARKALRGQAEGEPCNPPEPFAYSIADLCDSGPFGRSFICEEIRTGRLIARKARGRTIILPSDLKAYLAALPTIKHASAATALVPDPTRSSIKTKDKTAAGRQRRYRDRKKGMTPEPALFDRDTVTDTVTGDGNGA